MEHFLWITFAITSLLCVQVSIQYQACGKGQGFVRYGNRCYYFSRYSNRYADAKKDCENKGSTLASIHSAEEMQYIKNKMYALQYNNYYIGLWKANRDNDDLEANYQWIDGTKKDYKNWNRNEPNDSGGEDCVEVYRNSGKWNDRKCSFYLPYVCAVDAAEGWQTYNDNEYYVSYKPDEINRSWYESRSWCMAHGGDLTSILGVAELGKIKNWATTNGYTGDLWIGLNKLSGKRDSWGWSDNSEFSTSWDNWNTKPGDERYGALCGYQSSNDKNGKWKRAHCDVKKGFICKRPVTTSPTPKTTPTTPTVSGFCPAGYSPAGNKCFKVFYPGHHNENSVTFDQARDKCRKEPGLLPDLASIGSELEQALIDAHLQQIRFGVWIGLKRPSLNQAWTWTDNSPFQYTNWAPNEPIGNDEHCVEVWSTPTALGKWNNKKCSDKRGFVCQTYKDADNIIQTSPIPSVNFTCPSGFTPYWYGCYKFMEDKLTYDIALEKCSSFSQGENVATLVGIHAQAENAAIQTIALSKSTSIWLGFRDRNNSDVGEYKWEDGWVVWFTMWGPGQPVKAPNGGCVRMDPDGKWYDDLCYMQYPSVCKLTSEQPLTTPTPKPGRCQPGWENYGGHCYWLSDTGNTWQRAKDDCQSRAFFGSLASIHSHAENQWLFTKIQQRNAASRNFWIGLYRSQNDRSKMLWTDGGALQFEAWAPGEPNGIESSQDCVEMWNQYWPTRWNDHRCTDYKHYICKAPISTLPSIGTPAPSKYCPWGWKYEFKYCYLFRADDWQPFSNAQQKCRELGAELTSIHDFFDNVYIERQMKSASLLPQSQDYFWIGMKGFSTDDDNDNYKGQWLDNTEVDFTHWDISEPIWTSTHKCVSVQLKESGHWWTTECSRKYGYACRMPSNYTDSHGQDGTSNNLSGGAVAGIIIGCILGALLISLVVIVVLMQKGVVENKLPPAFASKLSFGQTVSYQRDAA